VPPTTTRKDEAPDKARRDLDPERTHAIEVRFLGRMTWMLLGVALMVGWGPLVPHGLARGLFLGAVVALVLALNVPAMRVVQRAAREGAPRHLVQALWVPLVLRGLATAALVGLLA
jgi:hypothetical protein